MKSRMLARSARTFQFTMSTLLAGAMLVCAALMLAGPTRAAKPAKPAPLPAPYVLSDLGSPRYRNWSNYWSRAYSINEPTRGVINIVGWDFFSGSTEWRARESGEVLSRDNLGPDIKLTAVNDGGLAVGIVDSHLFAILPDGGILDLPGSAGFSPATVNNLGHVVAQQEVRGYPELGQGAMWTIDVDGEVAGPIDLGSFRPLDINDSGEMAGLEGSVAAIASFEAGELVVTKLPGLSAGNLGVATAINNWGEVVGYSTDLRIDTGTYRPFLWTPDDGLIALGSLGGTHGKALGINDRGQIVGFSYTASPNSEQHAFLWQNDKMLDLNGQLNSRTLQSADAINGFGHIVGSLYTSGKTTTLKSFLLTPNR